jgi:hypothetical protein
VRLGHRNGYRPRTLTTQVGDLALQIPKLRSGSFLPSILDPRAPPPDRSGPVRSDHGGLQRWGLHPQGGCPGGGAGSHLRSDPGLNNRPGPWWCSCARSAGLRRQDAAGLVRAHSRKRFSLHCPGDTVFGRLERTHQPGLLRLRVRIMGWRCSGSCLGSWSLRLC